MPYSQLLIVHDQGHIPSSFVDGVDYLNLFMHDPYKKIVSGSQHVKIE